VAKPNDCYRDGMAGCAGCHMSFLDIDEKILDVVKLVDITASPVTDFKHSNRWTSVLWKGRQHCQG